MKVFKQLLKEFWIPSIIASIWTFFNHKSDLPDLNWILNDAKNFGAAFFLTSWFGGQIFRVIKQQKTESSLKSVLSRIETVSSNLENGMIEFKGFSTGGDSFCYLDVYRQEDGEYNLGLIHSGKYPLYDIEVSFKNLNDLTHEDITKWPRESFGELAPGLVTFIHNDDSDDEDEFKFKFEDNEDNLIKYTANFYCRNGSFKQDIRIMKFNNEWHTATRVRKGDNVVFNKISDTFPLKEPFE
jgi:hypothetical protein